MGIEPARHHVMTKHTDSSVILNHSSNRSVYTGSKHELQVLTLPVKQAAQSH